MKRLLTLCSLTLAAFAAPLAHADTEVVDGIEWNYELQSWSFDENGNSRPEETLVAAIVDRSYDNRAPSIDPSTTGRVVVPKMLGGCEVRLLRSWVFRNCAFISSIIIPSTVTSIERDAFQGAIRLRDVTFLGDVPLVFSISEFPSEARVFFPRKYGANWERVLAGTSLRGGWVENNASPIVDASIPVASPKTTFTVPYTVTSAYRNATVEVRLIAFKNAERTLDSLVIPSDISGVGVVSSGVEQEIGWKWHSSLGFENVVRIFPELLVKDGDVLPKETIEVPAVEGQLENPVTITRNGLSEKQVYQALLWYLAKKDSRLTIRGNAVFIDGQKVYEDDRFGFDDTLLLNYLYGKEGYAVLSGSTLETVETILGTTFPRLGLGQVAIKQ